MVGDIAGEVAEYIDILSDTRQATKAQKAELEKWTATFLAQNRARPVYDPALLDQAMFEALRDVKTITG